MGGSAERGQATVEWIGLVAAVGLVLAALVSGVSGVVGGGVGGAPGGGSAEARGGEARELGEALARRITGTDKLRGHWPGAQLAARELRFPPPPKQPPGIRPSAPWERPPGRLGLRGFPRLRRLGSVVDHAWFVCFGYRSLEYEIEHPRSPKEAMPKGEVLEIVNDCLNPWQFFFGG